MSIQLTRTYEVLSEHTFTITISQEEYDKYLLENTPESIYDFGTESLKTNLTENDVDYEDMYEYFDAKGHTVDMEDETLDYQSQGVTVEFL